MDVVPACASPINVPTYFVGPIVGRQSHISNGTPWTATRKLHAIFDLADEWFEKTFRRNVSDVDSRRRMGPENFIRILVIFSRHVLPLFPNICENADKQILVSILNK